MAKRYYSSRNNQKSLTLEELYWKAQNLYLLFRDQDYFKEKAGITKTDLPDAIKHAAAVALTFQPFPITKWEQEVITEDHVFDAIEFLHDHVSKPGEMEWLMCCVLCAFCGKKDLWRCGIDGRQGHSGVV